MAVLRWYCAGGLAGLTAAAVMVANGNVGAPERATLLAERAVRALVGREEPDRPFVDELGSSFPSRHAAIAVGVAVLVTPYLGVRGRWVVWTAAALACVADVFDQTHYPLDVFGGAGLGLFLASALLIAACRLAPGSGRGASWGVTTSPVVDALELEPHPEGGWFRETYRSTHWFTPDGYPDPRSAATAIYFLLHPGERSRWHVVRSDELWLWHSGGPLTLSLGGDGADPGEPRATVLGPDVAAGHRPQILVPGGTWQSAEPAGTEPVLVSCVVAPGFDYADFQLR